MTPTPETNAPIKMITSDELIREAIATGTHMIRPYTIRLADAPPPNKQKKPQRQKFERYKGGGVNKYRSRREIMHDTLVWCSPSEHGPSNRAQIHYNVTGTNETIIDVITDLQVNGLIDMSLNKEDGDKRMFLTTPKGMEFIRKEKELYDMFPFIRWKGKKVKRNRGK